MMNLITKLANWMGMDAQSAPRPEIDALRAALDDARRAKRTEDYGGAIASFDRAVSIAQQLNDSKALSLIHLHRADLLIRQQEWDAAGTLLRALEQEAHQAHNRIQLAYVQASMGTMAQAQGDWARARELYEQALKSARIVYAHGPEGRALGHLADTYLHEGNASYAMHLLREALPKLDSSGDIELSSYFVGRLGEAEIATGHVPEGKNLLSRALRLAEQMQYRRYERMWHIAVGRQAAQDGYFADAYKHFNAALGMMPADAPEMESLLREIAHVCLHTGHIEEAVSYADRAHLLTPDDPKIKGVLGLALRASGRSLEAIPYLEAAANNGEPLDIVRALGGARDDIGEAESAMATYQHALTLARKRGDSLETARALRDIGLHHARHNQHTDAIKAFSDALEIYASEGYSTQAARLHCDIANLRTYLGQGQRAMKDYEQALMRLGTSNDLETRGVVLSNAAPAYVDKGDLETAESFMAESIQIAQKLHDHAAEATRQGNYGWYLLVTGRIKRAVSALEYALQQSSRLNLSLVVAVQTMNLGQAYAEYGDPPKGESYLRRAVSLAHALNNRHWMAITQATLAAHVLKFGGEAGADEAALLADQAIADADAAASVEARLRARILKVRVLSAQRQYDAAIDIGHETVAEARKSSARRFIGEALAALSQAHALRGERPQAAALWEEAKRTLTPLHHPMTQGRPPEWLD